MQRQGSFSQAEYAGKKKQTRRDKFLAEMELVVPWARLVERLRPLYPKGERGRPPTGLERMLRIYFVQQWYGLADEALEDALYDSQALRGFAGIDLSVAAVPDATTVLNFRHWLEQHDLAKALFDEVGAMLAERGLLMRQGTIVDATIIAAPPSTKNKSKARDPEMHQTKKGNQWHFGMKAHIGVDVASGVVHTVTGTAANEADINQTAAGLARKGGGGLRRCRLYRGGQAARTCRPRCLLEHRDQAQHHQGVAQSSAGLGGTGGAGAVAGAGLGRAPVPHRQEPVPP
jgi:IS5 family transposase